MKGKIFSKGGYFYQKTIEKLVLIFFMVITCANAKEIVWTLQNSPYILSNNVTISQGDKLTIEPGVVVKLKDAAIYIDGTLIATSDGAPIIFTSWRDDAYGGDSNGDGTNSVPAANDWKGIYLGPDAGNSILNNCIISYSGKDSLGYYNWAYRRAGVYINSCSPTITHCTFIDNGSHGIEVYSSSAQIKNNKFINVPKDYFAVSVGNLSNIPEFANNSYTGEGYAIYIPSGSINTDLVFSNPGTNFPYIIWGDLSVNNSLEIEQGAQLLFNGCGLYINGTIKALGDPQMPVLFSSINSASAKPGDWKGIYLGPNAGSSILKNCIITYGGKSSIGYYNWAYRQTSVYVDKSSPQFDNVAISDSAGNGIELYSSKSEILNCQFNNCAFYSIKAESSSEVTVSNSKFSANGAQQYYAIGLDGSSVITPANNIFESNIMQGIAIWGGTLQKSTIWKSWSTNAPYVITKDLTVDKNTTLEIEPGTVVKFDNSGLYIEGTLIATSDGAPIIFTSWRDDAYGGDSNGDGTNSVPAANDWKGIYLGPDAGSSILNNCIISYSGKNSLGYYNWAYRRAGVYVNSCSPTITHCTFIDNGSHGIEVYSSSAQIKNNKFINVPKDYFAVSVGNLSNIPEFANNSYTGEGYAIYIPSGSINTDLVFSNPGTNFPYIIWGDLSVNNSLEIEQGAQLLFNGCGLYVYGKIYALGSYKNNILFGSIKPEPSPGDWKGIYLGPDANNSIMQFCTISHAGRDSLGYYNWAYRKTSLYIDKSSPTIKELTIKSGNGNGIELFNSSASVVNSLIFKNTGNGIALTEGSSSLIANNTIVVNNGSGTYCDKSSPVIVNNIIAFNTIKGIECVSSQINTINNNCLFGNTGGNYIGINPPSTDIQADPLFISLTENNYRPSAQSPCINAGDNSIASTSWIDLAGNLRIAEQRIDIGAFEANSTMATATVDFLIKTGEMASFIGEDIFDVDHQTVGLITPRNTAATYFIKLKYGGNLPSDIKLSLNGFQQGWTVKFFSIGASPIQLNEENVILTNIAPNTVLEYKLEVEPDSLVRGNETLPITIAAKAILVPDYSDTIQTITTNMPLYAVDASIRRAEEIRYVGKGIVNNNGMGQTKSMEVDPNEMTRFAVQTYNLGNIEDSIAIITPQIANGWEIRYFSDLAGSNDITEDVLAGKYITTLDGNKAFEFLVTVVGSSNIPSGSKIEIPIKLQSMSDKSKSDTVLATVMMAETSTTPQGGTYTLNSDFEKGILVGVEFESVPDQLQLTKEAITLPFIWVPNSNDGTVSKVDTRTGRELGRYRTGPTSSANPSRTTVDLKGNCWVGNRQIGTAVKIGLFENGQYIDRNGNGIIETSQDLNGDGVISGDEILPWGQDECVLYEVVLIPGKEGTFIPGTYTNGYDNNDWGVGVRGIAIDAKGYVWLGGYGIKKYFKVNNENGQIVQTIDVSSVNHTPYGAVVDANGILWSSGASQNHVLKLDTSTGKFDIINVGHFVYGLGLDRSNHLFVSGWENSKLTRINTLTGKIDWTHEGIYQSRGVAVTDDGDVWVANSGPGTVARWSNDGILKTVINVGKTPTGVSVDADGKVWVVNYDDEFIKRIDPLSNTIDLEKRIIGGYHYGYSDMTGIISRNSTTRIGQWTVIHNSKTLNTPWGTILWNASVPTNTSLTVKVRSSNDLKTWSLWEKAHNGFPLISTPPGKYLQIDVTMQTLDIDSSPILYDLTVVPSAAASHGTQVYSSDFSKPAGPEWSTTNTFYTPQGNLPALGPFGNTNVVLRLTDIPPHVAITLACDLLVIGSWDGNSTTNGPDMFEINVGGGLKLLHTTFNNAPKESAENGQAYPGNIGSVYPPLTGAISTNSLGYDYDAIYQLIYTLPHTANSIEFRFIGSGLDQDELWALAHVMVYITPPGLPLKIMPLGFDPTHGGLKLKITGEPETEIILEATSDLNGQWTTCTSTVIGNGFIEIIDPDAQKYPLRFYRVRVK